MTNQLQTDVVHAGDALMLVRLERSSSLAPSMLPSVSRGLFKNLGSLIADIEKHWATESMGVMIAKRCVHQQLD
jgi:hypothetical protein